MIDWETQKQLVRDRLERCFNDVDKPSVTELTVDFTIEPDTLPKFTYTVTEIIGDFRIIKVGYSNDEQSV